MARQADSGIEGRRGSPINSYRADLFSPYRYQYSYYFQIFPARTIPRHDLHNSEACRYYEPWPGKLKAVSKDEEDQPSTATGQTLSPLTGTSFQIIFRSFQHEPDRATVPTTVKRVDTTSHGQTN
jgi:hypothetical protein